MPSLAPAMARRSASEHAEVQRPALPAHAASRRRAEPNDDALSAYLRSLRRLRMMNAEQEHEAALQLRESERLTWEALLGVSALRPWLSTSTTPREPLPPVIAASLSSGAPATRRSSELRRMAAALCAWDLDRKYVDEALAALSCEAPSPRDALRHERAMGHRRRALALRNRFVNANLRLVVSIARRFHHHRLPLIDLIQEGNLGLIKSVDRFDPTKGFRFSTYAHWWIRQAIERAIMNKGTQVRLPVHIFEQRRALARVRGELGQRLGRAPTRDELACALDISAERLDELEQAVPREPASLDEALREGEPRPWGERFVDESQPSVELQVQCLDSARRVARALGQLSPMEADILRRRFGLAPGPDETLDDIGCSYGLSRERIRQIQVKGLRKLSESCPELRGGAHPSALG